MFAVILEFSEKISVQEQEIATLERELVGLRNDLDDVEVNLARWLQLKGY